MGHYGNSKLVLKNNFVDREDVKKEVISLLVEGAKSYRESVRQMKISKEITKRALLLSIEHNLIAELADMTTDAFIEMLEKELVKK